MVLYIENTKWFLYIKFTRQGFENALFTHQTKDCGVIIDSRVA